MGLIVAAEVVEGKVVINRSNDVSIPSKLYFADICSKEQQKSRRAEKSSRTAKTGKEKE
jgi:hypothetical protein